MTSSEGRANARNTATTALQASEGDVIKCSVVGMNASEEASRHEGYCAPECGDDDRSTAVFRWLIGRR